MKANKIKILILSIAVLLCGITATAQMIQVPIKILFPGPADSLRDSTVLTFGFDPKATYCYDPLFEYICPPPPPGWSINAVFQDPRGPNDECMGSIGFCKSDIRELKYNSIDTFEIDMFPLDITTKFVLSWDNTVFHSIFVSVDLFDLNFNPITNMMTNSIAFVNNNRGKATCVFIVVQNIVDGIKLENISIPNKFVMKQNYPNPFNPSTTISYQLPKQSHVTLWIYDVLGQEVATLVNEVEEPGNKIVNFNAGNLPSGVYYYRLQAGNYIETKKLILLR
jgi:hypothetical protein